MPAATDDASGERKEGLGLARLDLAAAAEVALGLPMVDVAVGKAGFSTLLRFGCRCGGGGRRSVGAPRLAMAGARKKKREGEEEDKGKIVQNDK